MTPIAKDQTVLVTAAAQGIGRAAALAFAQAGARVIALDINGVAVGMLAEKHEAITSHRLDVLDQSAIDRLVPTLGPIDVVFNCAGIARRDTLLDIDMEQLDFVFDLNVKSVIRMTRAVLPGMIARQNGSIINIAAAMTHIRGMPQSLSFDTTKAAVVGLTKAIAAEYIDDGIRCNAICPGAVDTESLRERLGNPAEYEAVRAAFIAAQPMGKIGTAEEVAALAVYLATATHTTGQAYNIDGGLGL